MRLVCRRVRQMNGSESSWTVTGNFGPKLNRSEIRFGNLAI